MGEKVEGRIGKWEGKMGGWKGRKGIFALS